MFTTTSIKRSAQVISLLGTGLLLAGCTDDAIEGAVEDIFSVPQTEEAVDELTDVTPPISEPPVTQPPVVAEPPVVVQPPVTQPPVVVQPPVTQPPVVVEPPVTQPPVVVEPPVTQPPVVVEPPVTQPPVGSTDSAFVALQRLQPVTRWDFTVTADNSSFSTVADFSSSVLLDEGADSAVLATLSDGTRMNCGYVDGTYVCANGGFPDGSGILNAFVLDANNTGEGIFFVCADLANAFESCIAGAPTGSVVVTAGQQFASAYSTPAIGHSDSGPDYLQYLATSEPVVSNRSNMDFPEVTEKVRNLIERSVTQ